MPNDKYEEIENEDLQTPGVREPDEDSDDDVDVDDGMDLEPETVGSRHLEEDRESGKGSFEKDVSDEDRIPQDSDPSE